MLEEKDYVMRIIHEMIRTMVKLLLNIDMDDGKQEVLSDGVMADEYGRLLSMIADGRINEAENRLYEFLDEDNTDHLELALRFYDKLNELDDEALERAGFSRDEVKEGLMRTARIYGCEGFIDTGMY
ncbi:DUF6483 family protein [Lachnotalea sp. AF33-28]|jgi:hypothetical protein|uniref:DUF6483 family protein n=1 Tax=Lachnotalea sp. AF33-28 TaxID=2292046 RepID=UPI000E53A97B|nr:DUF6483 family protein [Lachnotalea sp. AF33-28]RHP33982.1 hypothetical protein DWZ56_08945 [Lachnotalea sp. AF33-28]